MTENVKLHSIESVGALRTSVSEDAFLSRIEKFVHDNFFEIDDTIEDDVELEPPSGGEVRLGPLSPFERRCFVLGTILNQLVLDFAVNVEASLSEEAAARMRANRMSFQEAVQANMRDRQNGLLSTEDRIALNRMSSTCINLMSAYDWSVRERFNEFDKQLIVRAGFIAFSYE